MRKKREKEKKGGGGEKLNCSKNTLPGVCPILLAFYDESIVFRAP